MVSVMNQSSQQSGEELWIVYRAQGEQVVNCNNVGTVDERMSEERIGVVQ